MCSCANCQTRNRWENMYQEFLKKNPQQKEWIDHMRAIDRGALKCFDTLKKEYHFSSRGGDTI